MMNIHTFITTLRSIIKHYKTAIFLFFFAFLQVLIITIAFISGYIVRDWPYANAILSGSQFTLLNEAFKILQENAYNPLPDQKELEYGMIRGMLQAFDDPFTIFVEPPQHELQTNQLEGRFGGIGIRIDRDSENNVFIYPLPGSPAQEAGVQDGDRLIMVESLTITNETSNEEIQAAIRGPVGEKVKITVGREPHYEPLDFSIERAEVPIPSITSNRSPEEPAVGIVQIHLIASTTPEEVTKAILDLQAQGADRFIIDLRNNGGGLVDAGVDTARLFLKTGIVIQQQYRGEEVRTYSVDETGIFADLPIVLLVNKGTASAAEILSGALQGQKRAPVVGTPTYGKDTIQLVFSLSDGSSLHVTAAQWWVPGLVPEIGSQGLSPDVLIEDDGNPNTALQAAIQEILK